MFYKFVVISTLIIVGGFFMLLKYESSKPYMMEINNVQIPLIFEKSDYLPIGEIKLVFLGGGYAYPNVNLMYEEDDYLNKAIKQKSGLANLGAMILEEGTKKLGVKDFINKLESKAVELDVGAGTQTLSLSISFLKEYQEFALNSLIELLHDPNISEDSLSKVKSLTISSILRKENDFDYIANKNLNKIFFADSMLEFPSLGEIESIKKINLQDVRDYLEKNLVLNRLIIVAGGDMDKHELIKELKQKLAFLPNGEQALRLTINPNTTKNYIQEQKSTKQAYIYFASPYYGKPKDSYKAKVASFILGSSGFGSRILEELRVKRGLAYSAYFSINSSNSYIPYCSGYVQTGLESKDEAISVLKNTIHEFLEKGITEEELDSAKDFLLGSEPLTRERLSQRLNTKLHNFLNGQHLDFHKDELKKIARLDVDDMNKFIKEHPEISHLSISVIEK